VKTTPSPQPILPAPIVPTSDPFVKLGPSTSAVQFQFTTSSEDEDIASRFPTIEELSGGEFTSVTRSKSQPPLKTASAAEEVSALADDAFALPVQPYRKKEVDALADVAFNIERKPSPAAQIRAALERQPSQVEYVEAIMTSPPQLSSSVDEEEEEEERVLKPSEVIARGGIYANPPPHSISAPPKMVSSVKTAERVSEPRTLELRRRAEESRRIIDESRKILEEQWPDTKAPVPERPQMVSIGVNTSPSSSPPLIPADSRSSSYLHRPSPGPLSPDHLSSNIQRFALEETELRAHHGKSPMPSPSKVSPRKEYIQPEIMQPSSRSGLVESIRSPLGKGLPKARPQSLYINDLDFLRSHDKSSPPIQQSHTGMSTSSQPASLPSSSSELHPVDSEHDLEYLRAKDEEIKALNRQVSNNLQKELSKSARNPQSSHRRSSSSGPPSQKHSRQTSLGALSKGIMHGKFGDAFRKFEGFSVHDTKVSESRLRAEKTLAKLSPEEEAIEDEEGEDWRVETHELPVQMKQHLRETRRISAERETRPIITPSGEVRSASRPAATGSRARAIQQRMNEYLSAQNKEKPPPLTADGYGPYISSARAVRNPVDEKESPLKAPGIMPKPMSLRRPSLKGSID
jgi:hypothetical protein